MPGECYLWTEEPGGLLSMGFHRVGHDWSDLACMHALEKETAAHSSVLAGRIPGTKEPGGLPSMGSHRVRDDWSDLAAATIIYKISSNIILWSFCLLFLLNLCVHVLGTASLYKMYFSLLVTMKKVWRVVRVTTINRVRHFQFSIQHCLTSPGWLSTSPSGMSCHHHPYGGLFLTPRVPSYLPVLGLQIPT